MFTCLPYDPDQYSPACYEDLLTGRAIYHRVSRGKDDECMVEIITGSGQHYKTLSGDTYFVSWSWKGCDKAGSQGHLHYHRYEDETQYSQATKSVCRLFIRK